MPRTKFEPREGWWFSTRALILPHGDGRPVVIGEKISVKGRLVICQNALHGSYDPFDALLYAPGPILHKVLFSGARIEKESTKLGSRSRTVLASRDAEVMLWHFARRQALAVAGNWEMPDVARQYLETGDESLRSAAHNAAYNAAHSAAHNAAYNAAHSAAYSAAYSAAHSAAYNAACSAAGSAACSAAYSAARQMFNEMVAELFAA